MIENYINLTHTTTQVLLTIQFNIIEIHLKTTAQLFDRIKTEKKVWFAYVSASVAAAFISILLSLRVLFLALDNKDLQTANVNDVDSSSSKSTLTLTRETIINSSYLKKGFLLKRLGIGVVKMNVGALLNQVAAPRSNISVYNTITAFRVDQCKTVLANGINIWLNVASRLSYLTAPNTNRGDRKLKRMGESHFELKKSNDKPFVVKTKKQEITELDTQVNINCNVDKRDVKSTFLEGTIRISCPHGKHSWKIVKSGNLAINIGAEVEKIDTSLIGAFKNQNFLFQNENPESIMQKVERWFDVEIVNQINEERKELFSVSIFKNDKISKVLGSLKNNNVVELELKIERF